MANSRDTNIPEPEIIADVVKSISKCSKLININEPIQETVVYSGLENTTGCSLQRTSRKIPPIAPVITPIKLATNAGAPATRATNVPATAKVAKPAASAIKKCFGDIFNNLAAKNIVTALASDAIKNI